MAQTSVVIPTFNRAAYVRRALESVLRQTVQDTDVIVVDDGSTDDTRQVLSSYRDRIRYVHQPNAGVSAARNAGARLAESEWLAFLDSDDVWLPKKLERQLECVAETRAEVCFTWMLGSKYGASGPARFESKRQPTGKNSLFQDPFRLMWVVSNGLHVQTMLVKRDLWQQTGGFDESLRIAEDTHLIYRLALMVPFALVDEPLVFLERAADRGGLSDESFETCRRLYDEQIRILRDACVRYPGRDREVMAALRSSLGYALSRRAEWACADRDYAMARRLARDAICHLGHSRVLARSLMVCLLPGLIGRRRRLLCADS
jgi:glycosyltransferase involved in cell wall biosynthesis